MAEGFRTFKKKQKTVIHTIPSGFLLQSSRLDLFSVVQTKGSRGTLRKGTCKSEAGQRAQSKGDYALAISSSSHLLS